MSSVVPPRYVVHRFKELSSTNDWLLAAARGGAADRTVVVADHQLRGRGRLGRRWEAPPGSALLMSVLLRTSLAANERFLAPIALGLGACEACQGVAALRVGLKWPNDLVVQDRKLGGILAEADGDGEQAALVVGLGLNLTYDGPDGAGGTSLRTETGVEVDRDELLEVVLVGLDRHLDQLEQPGAAAVLLDAYRLRLATLGRKVDVQLHDEVISGTAVDVNAQGHLLIERPTGIAEIAAGDVVHLRDKGQLIDEQPHG